MIVGVVDAELQGTIRLLVLGANRRARTVTGIIDTGYSAALALPASLVAVLDLPFHSQGRAMLADGNIAIFDIHEATVIWDGDLRRVVVHVTGGDPLIGMSLLAGYQLTVEVAVGGEVRVEAMEQPVR